jgi:drug/metabolite transporter (DMT)-like permease
MTANTSIDRESWLLLVLLSFLWGTAFFFVGAALRELPPLTIVLIRVFLGAFFLLPFLATAGAAMPRTLAAWRPFVIMALLINVFPFCLLAIAQTYISSGLTSVLNATTPIFSVLIAAAMGDEPFSARRIAGVVVGLAGVAILRGVSLTTGYDQTVGILFGLAGALSYGAAGWWGRRALSEVPPAVSSLCQLLAASAIMAVVASAVEQPWRLAMPSTATILALLGLGALGTSLGYLVFFRILRRSGGTNAMLATLLTPVTAIILGHFVLGEALAAREIAGALVIGSALLLIDGRFLGLLPRSRMPD